jgi:hypothetical protein
LFWNDGIGDEFLKAKATNHTRNLLFPFLEIFVI